MPPSLLLDCLTLSTSPWKTLEGVIAQLMNSVSFYSFRLGKELIFVGPYPSYPEEPQLSPLDISRRSSAPSMGGGDSPLGSAGSSSHSHSRSRIASVSSESPVDRARAAAKMLLPRMGMGMGWNVKPEKTAGMVKDLDSAEHSASFGYGWDGALRGRSTGSTGTASVTTSTASVSENDGVGGGSASASGSASGVRRRGEPGAEGSRIERAVSDALER